MKHASYRTAVVVTCAALTLGGFSAWAASLTRTPNANTPDLSAPSTRPVAARDAAANHVAGDYVETRTCSVFAGACHYNGELVTTGRDAVMAWNITRGQYNGVDLSGVRAMAALSATDNLGQVDAQRKCEVVIDSAATPAQAQALVQFLQADCGSSLGKIASVRRQSVSFTHEGREYRVSSPGFADIAVSGMPNDECCKQPNLVWYTPLMPLEHRKVGYTQAASYEAGTLSDPWHRGDENSAFYGTFSK